jgi:pimeloyl-ACP methyl ester carboxylesterase
VTTPQEPATAAVVRAGDLDVFYLERGSGQPVVLVHGNWATSSWWEPLLARLPAGYRGVAFDVRGRGRTAGPDNDYAIASLAADLAALADALDLDSLHLVGHSLGSAIAMEFALEQPQRVASLAVIAPAWVDGMPEAYNVPAGQEAIKADRVLFGQALKMMAPTVPDDAYWQRLVAEGHDQNLEAALRNLTALSEWRPGDRLGTLTMPRVVISGALDALTGGANAERAAQALGARHVALPGVGHSPPIEAPEALLKELQALWTAA